jgi:hypothetical protein
LGEDIYLSYWAGKTGTLIVDPAFKVKHYQSPLSRDNMETVAYMEIINHYHLLQIRKKGFVSFLTLFWTGIGLLIKVFVIPSKLSKVKGYIRGLLFLLNPVKK